MRNKNGVFRSEKRPHFVLYQKACFANRIDSREEALDEILIHLRCEFGDHRFDSVLDLDPFCWRDRADLDVGVGKFSDHILVTFIPQWALIQARFGGFADATLARLGPLVPELL